MERPNVFQYAKKELSQDAMICWLFSCLDSELPQYQAIGLQFVRLLFQDDTIGAEDVRLADGPYPQYYRIDVYAAVSVCGLLYPIIFEDKTNTYLHGGQMQAYCGKVAEWMLPKLPKNPYLDGLNKKLGRVSEDWGGIIYVYFKTGYPSRWETKDFQRQANYTVKDIKDKYDRDLRVKEIYLDDMVSFLSEQIKLVPDALLEDYYKMIEDAAKRRSFVREHLFTNAKGCEEALSDEKGCNEMASILLLERLFGEGCKINYNYQHWASHNIFKTDPAGNETWYVFRFEWCNLEKKKWAYAFQLQQWRKEKTISVAKEEALKNKVAEAKQIQKICREISNTLYTQYPQVAIQWTKLNEYPCKSYDSQMLMKVFIFDKSTPVDVCEYLKKFLLSFFSKMNEVFGERYQKCQDE